MIQSITFGNKNTWDDWKILPVERPVFAPPKPKTNYIDIPGGNGALDFSESLSGYPVFENRSGTFQFRVMNDYTEWHIRYSEIMEYLHGQSRRAILADDPDWFYKGRFSVDGWDSGDTWSLITIGYTVDPYKWSIISSVDPWIWDTFNFDTGIIWQQSFSDISIDSPSSWVTKTFEGVLFGKSPISPTFNVSGASGLNVRFVNAFLGIDKTVYLSNGENYVPDFIFFGQDSYSLMFKGVCTVSIEFRVGRL